MSEEKIPTVKADKDGIVNCPYCQGTHRHGGRGNGIAFGQRLAECSLGEYIVIPFDSEINWGMLTLPAEEAKNVIQTLKKSAHLFSSYDGLRQVAVIFCQEMIAISSLSREHHPFKQYWEQVQEEIMKLPKEEFIIKPAVEMIINPVERDIYDCHNCKSKVIPVITHLFCEYKKGLRQLIKSKNCKECGHELTYQTTVFRDVESEIHEKDKLKKQGIKFIEQ